MASIKVWIVDEKRINALLKSSEVEFRGEKASWVLKFIDFLIFVTLQLLFDAHTVIFFWNQVHHVR